MTQLTVLLPLSMSAVTRSNTAAQSRDKKQPRHHAAAACI